MSEFKDAIPAASGVVDFIYDPQRGIQFNYSNFRALYFIAVSMDGRTLLTTVPGAGLGQQMVYPKPAVLTCIQSDEQGMWGRHCPSCSKYFRTTHVMDVGDATYCPYCAQVAPCLAFVTKAQRGYITAFYDAFAHAYIGKCNTQLAMSAVTDSTPAWHYAEVKQQFHFTCRTPDCHTQTDILGEYGFCPRCGRTNARVLFATHFDALLIRFETTDKTITDRNARAEVWEDITIKSVSALEVLAKHLRQRLLRLPMTVNRRRELEGVNFQKPLEADILLKQWFDISLFCWPGNTTIPARTTPASDLPFMKKMVQRRHIFMHNGGVVDQDYLDHSGDTTVQLGERVRARSNEAQRFMKAVRQMGENFMDNVEYGFE
jgi:hypothetical protein